MGVIKRVRFVGADICKRLNDFLSGNAGVELSHYPSPIALRSGLRSKRPRLTDYGGLNRCKRWQFQSEIAWRIDRLRREDHRGIVFSPGLLSGHNVVTNRLVLDEQPRLV